MNILFFLKPKSEVAFIYDHSTLRQVLETMEFHKYASIPMLNKAGEYVGTMTEGDLLWGIKKYTHLNVKEAETITASRIDQRLPGRNEKDELGELSQAFNELLERLEISFNSQKMFVSNVSHEMRTPLAALIAELDLCLQKDRTETQYRQAIQKGWLLKTPRRKIFKPPCR